MFTECFHISNSALSNIEMFFVRFVQTTTNRLKKVKTEAIYILQSNNLNLKKPLEPPSVNKKGKPVCVYKN